MLQHVATSSVDNHTSTTTAVVAKPAGVAAGDTLFGFLGIIGQPEITPPGPGWVLLGEQDDGTNLRTAVWRKLAGDSEPDDYTWTYNQARKNFAIVAAYRGTAGNPTTAPASAAGTSGTSHATPTVQVPPGGWLVTFAAARHQGDPQRTWTINTGDVERYDSGSAQTDPSQNVTGCLYDTSGPVPAGGGYDRVLTSSDSVDLVTVWSIGLVPATTGVPVPWQVGLAAAGPEPGALQQIISFGDVDSALLDVSGAGSITVPVPAGVASGQMMFAHITAVTAVTITPPAGGGWTQVGTTRTDGQLTSAVYRKLAGASEPDDYTWSIDGFTRMAGHIVAYNDVDTTDPVADHATTGTTSAGDTLILPTVTVPTNGWVLYIPCDRRSSPSVAQVWTTDDGEDAKRAEVSGATGSSNQASSAVFDSDRALSAGSPGRTITAQQGWDAAATVWAIAVRPSS